MLEALGIGASSDYDAVVAAVEVELDHLMLDAHVGSLRNAELTLVATPAAAVLLRYHTDVLRDLANQAAPDSVLSVKIQTRVRPGTPASGPDDTI